MSKKQITGAVMVVFFVAILVLSSNHKQATQPAPSSSAAQTAPPSKAVGVKPNALPQAPEPSANPTIRPTQYAPEQVARFKQDLERSKESEETRKGNPPMTREREAAEAELSKKVCPMNLKIPAECGSGRETNMDCVRRNNSTFFNAIEEFQKKWKVPPNLPHCR